MAEPDTEIPAITAKFDDEPLHQQTMNSVLENRAEQIGSEPFIQYGPEERTVTFAEMNDVANAIGNGLVDAGIRHEEKVSVMMRHPLETLFAMFGIHKAGGVYSPINFEYKGDALSYQLNDTDPEVLFIEDRYIERLNHIVDDLESLPTVVIHDTTSEEASLNSDFEQLSFSDLKNAATDNPGVETSWSDEASIVYTSGTTGRPKGVVLPHRWIFANYTLFFGQTLNEDDVVHTSLPLYHVGGVYADITSALVSGSEVALWDRFSPHDFWDRIDKYGATKTILLSVMMPWLMKQPEKPDDHENPLKMVHMQPLPDNYDELAERFGFDIVTAGFGQTESGNPLAGLIHASKDATPTDLLEGTHPDEIIQTAEDLGVPVVDDLSEDRYMGQEVFFMEAEVLDENDEALPPGEVGELAFRPKQAGILLKEYYNKPEKTVNAWRNLWFHTGDAAYKDEDGNFYFVDRIGDVIRRRGENISSMQIQDTLNAHDKVGQAAVFPVPAPEGGEDQIGAAIEPADPDDFSKADLTPHLDENLPDFMHPDELLVVDELPTTETNKIEKYKLRQQITGDD
ncbi:AMP-binding protein [Salinirussus salinus]|uniref:AMP-binding protein n=1 Tax=Salinirussus salinus TaxID=1198300 RepID=UPI00135C0A01|nr:AMP-binding protein [Salinirussus salinus]